MKIIHLLGIISIVFTSCSNNPAPPAEQPSKGADFMKEEKPKVDLTVIDAKAPVVKVTLIANGNTMTDMLFDKDTIRVPGGCTVELTLENKSIDLAMQHNFVLVENGSIQAVADASVKAGVDKSFVAVMDEVLIASKLTLPGEKTTLQFAAPEKGIYEFVCTYPGHYSKMKGVFVVE